MNAQLDQDLKNHSEQFRQDHDRLRSEFMESLESSPIPRRQASRSKRWAVRSLAAAAASLVVAAVWLTVLSGPTTLYAKALEALRNSRTVHIVGRQWQDDQWVKRAEVWYDKARGVREWSRSGTRTTIRIDDGTYQWQHILGRPSAIRSQSVDPVGLLVAKALLPSAAVMERFQPVPTGDREIDGVACRMLAYTNDAATRRTHLWIDDRNRLHRSEKFQRIEGEWRQTALAEAKYETPIDATVFRPDFGGDVKIVEAENLFQQRFSLETAICSQEALGMIVAVHELKRLEDDMCYVVFSTRATEDTIRRHGPIRSIENGRHKNGSIAYGDFDFYMPSKRVGENEWRVYQPVILATYYRDGTQIHWALAIQKGTWPEHVDTFEFGGTLNTRLSLGEERKKKGLPAFKKFRPMVVLPLPELATPLEDIVEQVYGETCLLEPFAFQLSLNLQSKRLTEQEVQQFIKMGGSEEEARGLSTVPQVSPSRTTLEEWEADVRANIESLR